EREGYPTGVRPQHYEQGRPETAERYGTRSDRRRQRAVRAVAPGQDDQRQRRTRDDFGDRRDVLEPCAPFPRADVCRRECRAEDSSKEMDLRVAEGNECAPILGEDECHRGE